MSGMEAFEVSVDRGTLKSKMWCACFGGLGKIKVKWKKMP
jgi:hypothetical protein